MADLEDYIDKDLQAQREKAEIIAKCKEFLEANGFEVRRKEVPAPAKETRVEAEFGHGDGFMAQLDRLRSSNN